MSKMVLHPTATAQWQALITEAGRSLGKDRLPEELESYLVFLLMRFTGSTHIGGSILATEFLKSVEMYRREREGSLRDVGDKCLLFAGFFPEIAHKRHVRLSYYVDLGRSAYATLSGLQHRALADLFANLSDHFVPLMDLLHTMRSLDNPKDTLDLIAAEELWRDTHSQHALNVLRKHVAHMPSALFPLHSNQKH